MLHILFILGLFFCIAGIIGCFFPIIPGPPVCWLGLLFYTFSGHHHISTNFLVGTMIAMLVITAIDIFFPTWISKKLGGGTAGVKGSILGLIIGLFFGPFGILLGPILGAFIFEYIFGMGKTKAYKSAFGAFIGFLLGTFSKLVICLIILGTLILDYVQIVKGLMN